MNSRVRIVIGVCLSLVVLLMACGSTSGTITLPATAPAKAQTVQERGAAYLEALRPLLQADKRAWLKMEKVESGLDATNAFSVAARIDSLYLPSVKHIQARLALIKPPPGLNVAHARLKQALTVQYNFLSFLRDGLNDAIYTHTVQPGFLAQMDRRLTRLRKTMRRFETAVNAAAKRLDIKAPPRVLPA